MKNIPSLMVTDEDFYWYTNKTFEYLLGFQPSLWYIIISDVKMYIILDSRYFDKLKNIDTWDLFDKIWKNIKLCFILLNKSIEEIIKENLSTRKLKLENSASLSFYNKLSNFWFEISLTSPIFEQNRITKDISEIKSIKKAIQIIAKVWKYIEALNKEENIKWKTELQIRQIIIEKIFKYWWTWESFPSIVAFWKNSAIPHHETGKTKIKTWPLLIDMGAIYNWYCSDFTRTLWVWKKDTKFYDKFIKIQKIVKKAHDKALKAAQIWIKCSFLDKIARDYITESWYWKYFTHSLWHWVWLNIHESPSISTKSNDIVKPWMTFTIEPGIYLPWEFWIRHENIVIISEIN